MQSPVYQPSYSRVSRQEARSLGTHTCTQEHGVSFVPSIGKEESKSVHRALKQEEEDEGVLYSVED